MTFTRFGYLGAAAAVLGAALIPVFSTSSYYLQVITQLLIYTILFVGLDVAVGQAGLVSMAHGVLFAIGAYTTGILTVDNGWSFWATLPIAVLLACAIGLAVAVVTLRLDGHYFVVATLGLGGVGTIVITHWEALTNGVFGISPIPYPESPGGWFDNQVGFYFLMLFLCVAVMIGVWLLMRTGTGQRLRAIRDNQALASAVGVDVARARLVAFVVSAGIAGFAGAFQASYLTFINPQIGNLDAAFTALLAIIVGGRASVAGPVIGAVIFVVLPEVLRDADEWRRVVLGVALIVVVIFAPDGIAGRIGALLRWLRGRIVKRRRRSDAAEPDERAEVTV